MPTRGMAGAVFLWLAGTTAADTLTGEFAVTSAYVWRGFALSDAPSVIGGFDYRHDDGWFGAAEVAGIRVDGEPEQRAQARAGVAKPWCDAVLEVGGVAYEYTRGDKYDEGTGLLAPGTSNDDDFVELFTGMRLGRWLLRYYRSEDYLGSGKLSNYFDFNYDLPLENDARIVLHYGYTDSPAIVDHAAQLSDMAFGVAKGKFSFVVTNLDDNEDGLQSSNPRFVMGWKEAVDFAD